MIGDSTFKALNDCYLRLLSTCDALEAVADALPGPVAADHCRALASATLGIVAETHKIEEQVLLPALAASTRQELRLVAERLRQEHAFDSLTAMEIDDALGSLADGRPSLSADAIGYLLRSFFESVRRHVHAEQDLILLISNENSSGRHHH
ncbi:hemerythrin domain-containing protein [Devosia sediminis]|uniref:Hemerythrin domain-containing protein n=1 Tax=Devosia sediminis TaxID=2798801 RepID=A0A934IUG0_9HYPH|nr:hemerythrin domain-containing protein [Devosia sediminis]MBJ3783145.1 hemerythrin domain-containing protein [Devosia sediminis]